MTCRIVMSSGTDHRSALAAPCRTQQYAVWITVPY